MIALRQRLADALVNHAVFSVEEVADAALVVFTDWLRSEEAEVLAMRGRRRNVPGLLTDLADAIESKDLP